jgi:hypothetical protein
MIEYESFKRVFTENINRKTFIYCVDDLNYIGRILTAYDDLLILQVDKTNNKTRLYYIAYKHIVAFNFLE